MKRLSTPAEEYFFAGNHNATSIDAEKSDMFHNTYKCNFIGKKRNVDLYKKEISHQHRFLFY